MNGSVFDVAAAIDSTRGGRRHGGLIDEVRDHDETALNEIVLPLMNVSRRLPDNTVNPKEPNQQQIMMTSAGVKSSFAYEKLLDVFEKAIIDPKEAFAMGFDYRLPILHGLLEKNFINDLKMSPSFQEESFAREYASVWTGGSEDSWFQFDKMQKYRKLKNPEMREISRPGTEQFYLLSVDFGRIHDQSPVCVFRVNVKDGRCYASLVNLEVIGRTEQTKTFQQQTIDLKLIIERYNPREVLIDTNGIGLGFGEMMTQKQYAPDGHILPSYGFFNDDNFKKTQPKDCIPILYSMKANGPLKSQIHGNCYSRMNSGLVRFLIKESEAKSALLATKIGQKMTLEQRVKRLLPHEMTTKLFEEMSNLRLKRTGTNLDIVLEPINTRFPDDKYMSFAYGLWRIKEIEETYQKSAKRRGLKSRSLLFYTGGN